MSTINDAKFILIPSGYKSQKVYSVKPTNGDGDFTFARTSSATRLNGGNNIETLATNMPRLNYFGSCPSLLLEGNSTNSHTYSEVSTGKTLTNITLTNDSATSPSGEFNAMELKEDTNNGKHRFNGNSIFVMSSRTYTISMFVKKNSDNRFVFINAGALLNASGSFDLDTQATTGDVEIFNNYGNGWYRIGITATAPSTLATSFFVQIQQGTTDVAYTGDGTSNFYIWGLQFEELSAVSSYIKTEGSSASRTKDQCLNGGNSTLFDISEGSFFVDVKPYKNTSFYNISLSDGSADNRVSWQFQNNNTQVKVRIVSGGSEISQVNESVNFGSRNKLCVTFKNNEFKTYINGSLVETITSGNAPTSLDVLNFAVYNGTNNYFQGEVYDVRVYDVVLTQTQANELTTL